MGLGRGWAALALVGAIVMTSAPAQAFCGFYVAGADGPLYNDATMVVLVREGTHTVLSMRNDYRGPPEDFAMVVPVPEVLERDDVRTLEADVFEAVERLAAPRLVEYWERDPCEPEVQFEGGIGLGNIGTIGHGGGSGSGYGRGGYQVTIEAEFAVGEYEIVILGARDSNGLEAWLRDHGYRIPDGAAEVLRPYVEAGTKFFVAKVSAERVTFEDGRAVLSPLRIHYESESFSLPVRLGMLNSSGTQDLLVHVLATDRYEVANYENVTVPTNLDLQDGVRDRFGEAYAAIFDETLARHPGAVVTEYAWPANNCDPCPGDSNGLTRQDTVTLGVGVSVAEGASGDGGSSTSWVGQVRANTPTVRGSLSGEVIRRVIRRHINEVKFCHEANTQGQTLDQATTSVRVQFIISPTGAVQSSRIPSSSSNAALDGCVAQAVRRWTFPAPDGGGVVAVDQTFRLSGTAGTRRSFGRFAGPSLVLTRLHYRYEEGGLQEDLVFREASPIVGGREIREDGELSQGASEAPSNNFQARYAIRHAWEGPIECDDPIRGRWGGPPEPREADREGTKAAMDLAHAPRGHLALGSVVAVAVPALGVDEAGVVQARPARIPEVGNPHATPNAATDVLPDEPEDQGGCGCRSGSGGAPMLFVVGLLWFAARRRLSARG